MRHPIPDESIEQLFTKARSHRSWTERPVSQETLRELYEVMKWAPTSVNLAPARFVFVQTELAKEKLYPYLMDSNVAQVKSAPVTVIIAYDEKFYANAKRLYPAYDTTDYFKNDSKISSDTTFRNSSLQGAYLIMAARALGLDTNSMSGFDNAGVDKAFFAGTDLKSNFLCTLGYGDDSKLFARGPRLSFDEVCQFI